MQALTWADSTPESCQGCQVTRVSEGLLYKTLCTTDHETLKVHVGSKITQKPSSRSSARPTSAGWRSLRSQPAAAAPAACWTSWAAGAAPAAAAAASLIFNNIILQGGVLAAFQAMEHSLEAAASAQEPLLPLLALLPGLVVAGEGFIILSAAVQLNVCSCRCPQARLPAAASYSSCTCFLPLRCGLQELQALGHQASASPSASASCNVVPLLVSSP